MSAAEKYTRTIEILSAIAGKPFPVDALRHYKGQVKRDSFYGLSTLSTNDNPALEIAAFMSAFQGQVNLQGTIGSPTYNILKIRDIKNDPDEHVSIPCFDLEEAQKNLPALILLANMKRIEVASRTTSDRDGNLATLSSVMNSLGTILKEHDYQVALLTDDNIKQCRITVENVAHVRSTAQRLMNALDALNNGKLQIAQLCHHGHSGNRDFNLSIREIIEKDMLAPLTDLAFNLNYRDELTANLQNAQKNFDNFQKSVKQQGFKIAFAKPEISPEQRTR